MDLKTMGKSVEKYTLKLTITLEELYTLMQNRWKNDTKGNFKIKKGFFGKSIIFDVFMQAQPKITVKNNIVTCRRIDNKTTVSVGGSPALDFKDMKQRLGAAKEGGAKSAVLGGQEYFLSVCDALRNVLHDKI